MPEHDRPPSHFPSSGLAPQPQRTDVTADFSCPVPAASVSVAGPAPHPRTAGRYEILEEIARGGMGVVYRAHDPAVKRSVAVKVLQERFRQHPAATSRFVEEGQVTGQLQHPGIPAVHEIGALPDGSPFLAMKLIRGVTLDDLIAGPDPDRGQLVGVFHQVAQAVGYAHSKGVIHRDLKPANIMVGQFGEVQVMDWGLAKVLSHAAPQPVPDRASAPAAHSIIETARSSDPGTETQAGSVLGTPAYMAPEQAAGEVERVDRRTDVFGLGGLLCAVLTGDPPFRDGTAEVVRLRAVRGEVQDAYDRLDGCGADPDLVALCKRCLAPDPEARPRDAGEVATAVSAHLAAVEDRLRRAERERAAAQARAAEEVNTRRVAEEKAAEQRRRRRAQRALLLCLGLLLFGAGATAWWADRQAGERRAEALRCQIEDQERAQEDARREAQEQQRLARNAQAVESLLGQCEDALRNDAADRAATALDLARQRDAEGGGEHLRSRFERYAAELAMLRTLDRADELRWTGVEARFQIGEADTATVEAFGKFGIVPGRTPPEEAARRVNDALIRDRLLTALDEWLARSPSPALRVILRATDPDPYRSAVREAVLSRNADWLRAVAAHPDALRQPPRFTTVLGGLSAIPPARREQLLLEAHRRRPGDYPVLMALASLSPPRDHTSAAKGAGWYRAALAVRPASLAAWNNLGFTLRGQGDLDGAILAYREVIRLSPPGAPGVPYHLANALKQKGDLEGAAAAYREEIRRDPNSALTHNYLGDTLKAKGDLDGAVAEYREAIRLDTKSVLAHVNLGHCLRQTGDLDGAVAAFKEALRLNPRAPALNATLQQTEQLAQRWGNLLPRIPDIAAGRDEPKDAADALALAEVCREPFQKRYALAVRLAVRAFAAEPALANDLAAGHRFHSATAAARAAAGKDPALPAPGAEERVQLRGLARMWLRADLTLWAAHAKDPKRWPEVNRKLRAWKASPDLAALRDPPALAAMPPAERKEWEALWAEVEAILLSLRPRPAKP